MRSNGTTTRRSTFRRATMLRRLRIPFAVAVVGAAFGVGLSGCTAPVGAVTSIGAGAAGGASAYFTRGDIRLSLVAPFDDVKPDIEAALEDLALNIDRRDAHPGAEHPRHTWDFSAPQGRGGRINLYEVTPAVSLVHVDIDVLTHGEAAASIALLLANRIALTTGADNEADR